jgi:hypothetical protein
VSPLVDRAGTPLAIRGAPGSDHDGALGFLPVVNSDTPPRFLNGIVLGAAQVTEPTLLAANADDSLRFHEFVREHPFRPLIPN